MNTIKSIEFLEEFISIQSKREITASGHDHSEHSDIPRRILQFWSQDMPDEIRRLAIHNSIYCANRHIQYSIYNQDSASIFISTHFPKNVSEAFERSISPTMKAELFKFCELYINGGWWLDADMAVREDFLDIFSIGGKSVVFKWDGSQPKRHNARNVCAWFFGFSRKDTMLLFIINGTASAILQHTTKDNLATLTPMAHIQLVGPGSLTRLIANYLNGSQEYHNCCTIKSVKEAYTYILNGPQLLGEKLNYKNTDIYWKQWQATS